MTNHIRWVIVLICLGAGLVACQPADDEFFDDEFDDEPLEEASDPAGLFSIENVSGVEICSLFIDETGGDEWIEEYLEGDPLLADDILDVELDPGIYDFGAFDCNDESIDEVYEVEVTSDGGIWLLGEGMVEAEAGTTAAPQTAPVERPQATEGFSEGRCLVDIPAEFEATCGFVTVPENRTIDNSPTIDLAVVVASPVGGATVEPPIVYLAGGPGGSGLLDFADDPDGWSSDFYPFLAERTLILVDQRGTGFSTPSLNCPEEEDVDEEDRLDAVAACRNRLTAEGIDLTAYNNDENANDIADVVTALGYGQVDLWGISYGTRLGLGIMRDHPEIVRSATLDSVYPNDVNASIEESVASQWVLEQVFEACSLDSDCAAAYPDLEATYYDTVAALDASPLIDSEGFDVDGFAMVDTTTGLLGDTFSLLLIPRLIYDLNADDTSSYDFAFELTDEGGFNKRQDGEDRTDSEGLFYSITCRDEFSFVDASTAEAEAAAQLDPTIAEALYQGTADQYAVCDIWSNGSADPIENEPVTSDIPTLLLAGTFDTATPPYWTQQAGETLSNSYYVEITNGGHSVTGTSECAVEVMSSFLDDPASAPNTSCVAGLELDLFFLPEDDLAFE